MTAQKGALVLIKTGDGGDPEAFTTIGGLRTTRMTLNNRIVDSSNLDSGAWRQLLADADIRSLRISGGGIFTDSASEETVRGDAFAGVIRNYRFIFANGDYFTGPFLISAYERSGNHDDEELYALTLESAGEITFMGA